MLAATLVMLGCAMIGGGFWSMWQHETIGIRFTTEIVTVYAGQAAIGAGILAVML